MIEKVKYLKNLFIGLTSRTNLIIKEFKLNSKYIDEQITAKIDIILLLFNFSFKKIYPKKIFNIGNIK